MSFFYYSHKLQNYVTINKINHIQILKFLLNEILQLNPKLPLDNEYQQEEIRKAVGKFNSWYFINYKQSLNRYRIDDEELFVILGAEFRKVNESKFQEYLYELNDPRWATILTGKIVETRQNGNQVDSKLKELFTKGGIVEGAGQHKLAGFVRNNMFNFMSDNHNSLGDGQLHTIHIYGDLSATTNTGIYIPKEFLNIKFVGGSQSSLEASNPVNGTVIRVSHILINKEIQFGYYPDKFIIEIQKQLNKNMLLRNDKGSIYVGECGGPGGHTDNYIHSHSTIFKNKISMKKAIDRKYKISKWSDYDSSYKEWLGDFRDLIDIR